MEKSVNSKSMIYKPVYCASEGRGVLDVISSLVRAPAELPAWPQLVGGTVLATYLGRVAAWLACQIWQLGPEDEVLMPAYNCGTEVDPFLSWGTKVIFYRTDEKTRIDVEDIRRRATLHTKLVYVTHYFGWPQDLGQLRQWCHEQDIALIEDCALALFSSGKDGLLGTIGDAAIFSFRKTLPVPDGGALVVRVQNRNDVPTFRRPPATRTFKNTLPLLKARAIRYIEKCGLYAPARRLKLHLWHKPGSHTKAKPFPDMPSGYYFDRAIQNWAMSQLSAGILNKINPDSVVERRRENYIQLYQAVSKIPGVSPLFDHLPDGVCPLGLPVIVKERSCWAKALNAYGIAAIPWWEGYNQKASWDEFPEARYLKDNVLFLPIHHILDKRHMRFIAECMSSIAGMVREM